MGTENFYKIDPHSQPLQIEFLIPSLIPRKGVGILWGKSQTGKSLLCLQIAASLAGGLPLAIQTQDPPLNGVTLYFCGEGENAIAGRIKAAAEANATTLKVIPLPIVSFGIGSQKLQEAKQLEEVWSTIQYELAYYATMGLHIRLIIFDTLAACFSIQDENSNSEMQRIISALKAYSEQFDCFVLVVAHPSKPRKEREVSVRGAGTLTNSADVVLKLEKINDSPVRLLTIVKLRDGGIANRVLRFRLGVYSGLPALIPDLEETTNKEPASTVISLTSTQQRMVDALTKEPLNKKQLQEVILPLMDEDTGPDGKLLKRNSKLTRIKRNLEKLEEAKVVIEDESGIYKLAAASILRSSEEDCVPSNAKSEPMDELQIAIKSFAEMTLKLPRCDMSQEEAPLWE